MEPSYNPVTCPNCNALNPDWYIKCRKCGSALNTTTKPKNSIIKRPTENFDSLIGVSEFITFLGWIVIIASFLGIIVGIYQLKEFGPVIIVNPVIVLVTGIS